MAASPRGALLLDFDGVVFRHPEAFGLMHRRVEAFVASRLPTCMPQRVQATVHNEMFKTHGHTLLGLRARFGTTATIADFNRYVFDDPFIERVRAMTLPNDHAIHARAVRSLLAESQKQNMDVFIFTNAPLNWVRFALSTTGLASFFDETRVLVAEELGHLKPEYCAYQAAQARVCESVGAGTHIVFVDDSVVNLAAAPRDWVRVLYDPSSSFVHDVLPGLDGCGVIPKPAWWIIRDLACATRFTMCV